jgi:hypothetical protein
VASTYVDENGNVHDAGCKWERGGEPCRRFSTDGTRLGAQIAHTMGTDDEEVIRREGENDDRNARKQGLTGMTEEQVDWEAEDASGW